MLCARLVKKTIDLYTRDETSQNLYFNKLKNIQRAHFLGMGFIPNRIGALGLLRAK